LQDAVLRWFASCGRDFPWRNTHNAFHILIAEVLLRQTQAERLVKPYLELVSKFPNPQSMTEADVAELRDWFHPLGLVKRADRLVETAKILVCDFGRKVPRELEQLKDLPGLGDYSARAVLCLAYNIQVPMIDEGSGRVLRRVLNLRSNKLAYSDRQLIAIAERVLPKGLARDFNLGLIDIAAMYCHSKNSECAPCPLLKVCSCGHHTIDTLSHSVTF
jgi:A/G-specific adenine glycosylase